MAEAGGDKIELMRYLHRAKYIVILSVTLTTILFSQPASSFFQTDLNFLIFGSAYLNRPNWTEFRIVHAPTLLSMNDELQVPRRTSAVVLCSNLKRRTIPSGTTLLSTICLPSGGAGTFRDGGSLVIPTSIDPNNNERRALPPQDINAEDSIDNGQKVPSELSNDRQAVTPNLDEESQEIESIDVNELDDVEAISKLLDDVDISDEARAFVIASVYRKNGLIEDAVSTLERALPLNNRTVPSSSNSFNQAASHSLYRLLGDLYRVSGNYEKAGNVYAKVLGYVVAGEPAIQNSIATSDTYGSANTTRTENDQSISIRNSNTTTGDSVNIREQGSSIITGDDNVSLQSSNRNISSSRDNSERLERNQILQWRTGSVELEESAEALLGLGEVSLLTGNYEIAIVALRQAQLAYAELEGADSETVRVLDPYLLQRAIELEGVAGSQDSYTKQAADYIRERISTGVR